MRVADHGLQWKEIRTTCPKCQCEFLYRPKDIKEHLTYDFDTFKGRAYRYVLCPECLEEYIHVDPISKKKYDDVLTGENASTDIIYDGGDEDVNPEDPVYDGTGGD